MSLSSLRHADRRPLPLWGLALAFVLVLAVAGGLWAQVSGDRGIAPIARSTDIEVTGIEVDVSGDSAEDARREGWLEAQRLAWEEIDGPDISDNRLESLVSAIVVEQESLGPRRYIARLGVIFDRQRAGALLGAGGERARSAPMLTLPVMVAGGTQTMFERRNPWQRAWAEYQSGASAIDYVRPSGAGGESLLLTFGQTGRRSRVWWNEILDQFGAADVLVPVANLRYQWPGGPVEGHFTARYGPDSMFLASFTMRAESAEQVPAMLRRAVQRFDTIYTRALSAGTLTPDPTLSLDAFEITPEIRALIEEGRRAEETPTEEVPQGAGEDAQDEPAIEVPEAEATEQAVTTITVQVATPDAAAFDGANASLRATGGVRSVASSSLAIGGTSVFRVSYAGDIAQLAEALRGNGWQVTEGAGALAISR